MRVVIDIDEKVKRYLDQTTTSDMEDRYVKHFSLWIAKAIKEGTVLPTGHGDLIDRDTVLDMMNYGILEDNIKIIPSVIPSDKGEE